MTRVPSALVAAASLLVGFGVAEATGVRALGGVVLLAGLAVCVVLWRRRRGTTVAVVLSVAFLALFVVSHPVAHAVGAWPSVIGMSVVMAAATWLVADVPARQQSLSG